MTEWQPFEFGVTSIDGDQTKYRFPHPVECANRKARNFGVQDYQGLQNHLTAEPGDRVADLHTVAVACYIADKHYRRDESSDGWTRRFQMKIPVIDPEPWENGAGALFTELLEFLTSDQWRLEFRPHPRSVVHRIGSLPDTAPNPVEVVSLFSGGLDSFCHNVIAASNNPAPRLLIGHCVPNQLIGIQKSLSTRIQGAHCSLAQFRVEPNRIRDWSPRDLELTQRTRTLLFMTTALLACDSRGVPVLEVPENGLLALNPPLNATRVGGSSTKSVHPSVLHLMNQVLERLALDLRVENPIAHLTKGELCRRAVNVLGPGGLSTLARTVSCSSMMPGRTRDTQRTPNCGRCYPCLIRHASLDAAGGDRTSYNRQDFEDLPMLESPARHRRALRRWLGRPFGTPELLGSGALPPGIDIDAALDVIRRSRAELEACYASE